jgi:HK97 family phage portal protein
MSGLSKLRSLLPSSFGGTKALTSMVHGNGGLPLMGGMLPTDKLLPDTKIDYAKEVGDGLSSSVLMAPLNFIMRTFPEAPAVVERRSGDQWNLVHDHALTKLLRRPNPFYGGLQLAMATVLDLSFGEAYWLKIRNTAGEVIQLWWAPRMMMTPRWPTDGMTFISHYDYSAGGRTIPIEPRDVVHFRFGLDPRNIRHGLSPLGSLVRDVMMDDQAATFATAILKNLGVIGVVISPKTGNGMSAPATGAVKETKQFVHEHFTGENRGKTLALGAPTDVELLQYNMQGFDVSPLRDVSEERVCAALGIPAAVVGFGTGLQQTKVGATMKEMRQLAWTGGLMPMQRIIAEEIDRSLLPGFEGDEDQILVDARMRFDTTQVRALWEDTADKHDRVRKDYLAGIARRSEARRETGRPVAEDGSDDVYVQPVNVVQLGPNGQPFPSTTPSTNPPDITEDGDA